MQPVNRILVPVASASDALVVCDYALGLAEVFGARGTVLHVRSGAGSRPRPALGTPLTLAWDCIAPLPDPAATEPEDDDARALLEVLPEPLRARFAMDVEQGDVVETILEVADRDRADLIVVGTHGRTGASHLLLGSVAERLVRRAACPVLTVRLAGGAA